ncbi:MAG: helix-hairpin-helix domain-containing protein [Bacteroidales bacterium]|nr:helix-hairpin-helix domain-containing protein [Bacteroidales bacterium]
MCAKEKNNNDSLLSKGITFLIFLMLAFQFGYFLKYAIKAHAATHTTPGEYEYSKDTLIHNKFEEYYYDGWKWDMVELNTADSAMLVDLPGIGPYYAKQILHFRDKLWGSYAHIEQLLEIRGIDTTLLKKIDDRIYIEPSSIISIDLTNTPADSLAKHPYIGSYSAKGIERFRKVYPDEQVTVEKLLKKNIITKSQAYRLKRYCR